MPHAAHDPLATSFICTFLLLVDFFFAIRFLLFLRLIPKSNARTHLHSTVCTNIQTYSLRWTHTRRIYFKRNTWYNNVQRNTEIFQFTQHKGRTCTLISDSFHRTSPDFIGEHIEWLLSHQQCEIPYIKIVHNYFVIWKDFKISKYIKQIPKISNVTLNN